MAGKAFSVAVQEMMDWLVKTGNNVFCFGHPAACWALHLGFVGKHSLPKPAVFVCLKCSIGLGKNNLV